MGIGRPRPTSVLVSRGAAVGRLGIDERLEQRFYENSARSPAVSSVRRLRQYFPGFIYPLSTSVDLCRPALPHWVGISRWHRAHGKASP